jgi:hypothetical protein
VDEPAQMLIELEDRGNIAAPVAVIWRRPNRHKSLIKHVLVSLHNELVSPRDQLYLVGLVELSCDVAAK